MTDGRAATNPMFGPNRLKLGIFSDNCDGGLTASGISPQPPRPR